MNTRQLSLATSALGAFALAPLATAHAHGDHSGAAGLVHGFAHPLLGVDHLLAMVAVGLLAAKTGGRAIWILPVAFLSAMVLGGVLGMNHVALPAAEHGIIASLLILGSLVAIAARVPLAFSAPLVALLALFHGYAHGVEAPATSSGLTYALGFLLATAGLHAAGIALGLGFRKGVATPSQPMAFRFAGLAVLFVGLMLWTMA